MRKKQSSEVIRIVKDTIVKVDDTGDDQYWQLLNQRKPVNCNSVLLVTFAGTKVHKLAEGTELYIAVDQSGNARRYFHAAEFELADS